MPTIKSPTETQAAILRAAADRNDHNLLPLPDALKLRGASRNRVLAGLLAAGLAHEVPGSAHAWRTGEDGQQFGLMITDAGLEAIGRRKVPLKPPAKHRRKAAKQNAPEAADRTPTPTIDPPPSSRQAPSPRPGSKLAMIVSALSAKDGATLDELVTLTGWLPHTTRASLTRLRQGGYALARVREGDRKAYRISTAG